MKGCGVPLRSERPAGKERAVRGCPHVHLLENKIEWQNGLSVKNMSLEALKP